MHNIMSIRLIRLNAEYQKILHSFAENPHIRLSSVVGEPPEEYQIEYNVKGLVQENNIIREVDKHLVKIMIPRNYPVEQPVCKMLTPIFHPNIDPYLICIADPGQWAPSEPLISLIVRIGKIITYQSYNIKSPRNGEAAQWADMNKDRFPVDHVDLNYLLYSDNSQSDFHEIDQPKYPRSSNNNLTVDYYEKEKGDEIKKSCANCGVKDAELKTCMNNHLVCDDCILSCENCHKTVCVLCDIQKCEICGKINCRECITRCDSCKQYVCKSHINVCYHCNNVFCSDCLYTCSNCHNVFCLEHFDLDNKTCSNCSKNFMNDKLKITYNEVEESRINEQIDLENQLLNVSKSGSQEITCWNCGKKINPQNVNYCIYCGKKIIEN